MYTQQQHIEELFEELTLPLEEDKTKTTDLRVITLEGFKIAIETMMQKAYQQAQDHIELSSKQIFESFRYDFSD